MSSKLNIQAARPLNHQFEVLSSQYIQETLSIYKPEYIYLTSAKWNGSKLVGCFRLEHYPFTKETHIDYVTASMLMLYLSQLGFLYARILCERDLMPSGIKISNEEFFNLRDEGNMLFVGFKSIKLHRKIFISESALQIKSSLERIMGFKGCPVADMHFDVDDGSFSGVLRMIIIR